MREILYHPAVRLLIGIASLCVGFSLVGVFPGFSQFRGNVASMIVGFLFMAYGLFNIVFAVQRFLKKRKK